MADVNYEDQEEVAGKLGEHSLPVARDPKTGELDHDANVDTLKAFQESRSDVPEEVVGDNQVSYETESEEDSSDVED